MRDAARVTHPRDDGRFEVLEGGGQPSWVLLAYLPGHGRTMDLTTLEFLLQPGSVVSVCHSNFVRRVVHRYSSIRVGDGSLMRDPRPQGSEESLPRLAFVLSGLASFLRRNAFKIRFFCTLQTSSWVEESRSVRPLSRITRKTRSLFLLVCFCWDLLERWAYTHLLGG